jgi:YVTN family beta-propeller protein
VLALIGSVRAARAVGAPRRRALLTGAALSITICVLATASAAHAAIPYTAYVANWGAGTVTPINTATNAAGAAIAVGGNPTGIAITPDGKTAYVANYGSGTVTPITVASNTAGTPITVGSKPASIAITPDGKTAYVSNSGANTVTPITVASNTAGAPITVGSAPVAVTITPDGKTAFVVNSGANTVTPIAVASNTAGASIAVGEAPIGIAISPDGASAYVADSGFNTLTPITLATNTTRAPITVGNGPWGIAITPDGASAYVANLGSLQFTGNTSSGSTSVGGIASTARLAQGMTVTGAGIPAGTTIAAPPGSSSITLSQAATATQTGSSLTASESATVTPVNLATQAPGTAIGAATSYNAEPAITPDQAPVASFTTTAGVAGSASSFNASASTVAYGAIASYAWNFGDGSTATTSSPNTTHVYTTAGTYTATLTETDAAGTSTAQVFTGQTMSRHGGPSAQTIRTVQVALPVPAKPSPANGKPSPASGKLTPAPTPAVLSTRSVTMTARGDAEIQVSCPVSATGGCRGTITIRLVEPNHRRAHAARCARGCRSLGSAKYEARAGQQLHVRVHMASFARKLIVGRKAVRVTVAVTSVSGGHTATVVGTITLKARTRRA